MIKEAIILAGGLGTRLKDAVPDKPKSMAPVAGLPFLSYVIRHLLSQGIRHIVFSLGYKHEMIEDFLKRNYGYLNYSVVIEKFPLGTGGAIMLALGKTTDRDILIVNGDTLYKVDVDDLNDHHIENQSDCTLALKPMLGFDRYGAVEIGDHGRITKFQEKKLTKSGNINGGVYLLNKNHFINRKFPEVFSFEKDYLEAYIGPSLLHGVIQEKYFVDIGIPQDYEKVQIELAYPVMDFTLIDQSWTLFLDRDGVINVNKDESYVFTKDEFQFIPGVNEAIASLSKVFGKIIIITNQRGIGKGLMDELALNEIHQ
ncbi:MAG: sugar phosphate nucleotidyltransferase, partial [Saprospiraceae bacterium]